MNLSVWEWREDDLETLGCVQLEWLFPPGAADPKAQGIKHPQIAKRQMGHVGCVGGRRRVLP